MSAITDVADRIERTLKLHRDLGVEVKFTLKADAAASFVEQLRLTDELVSDHERLRGAAGAARQALRDMIGLYEVFAGEDECDLEEGNCGAPICKGIDGCAVERAACARQALRSLQECERTRTTELNRSGPRVESRPAKEG